jgi:hypothetical protein
MPVIKQEFAPLAGSKRRRNKRDRRGFALLACEPLLRRSGKTVILGTNPGSPAIAAFRFQGAIP